MGKKKAEDILNEDKLDVKISSGDKEMSLARTIVGIVKSVKDESFSKGESAALWNEIYSKTTAEKEAKLSTRKGLVAAVVLFAIGAVFYLYNGTPSENGIQQAAIANKRYLSKSDKVQFINADKKKQVLNDTLFVYHKLNMATSTIDDEQIRYNSIGVPYGKRTEIMLEDGTKVWLNAGSTLTFPEKFNGEERAVYLEGEGYFEIAKDAKRPFFVLSEVMKVEVLGTTFNLSSYADDDYTSVILLTGNIALLPNGNRRFEKQLLKPGMEAQFKKSQQKLFTQQTSETSISWTKKRLLLSSMNLDEMLKKLERFYNAEIEVSNNTVIEETFSGSLDLTQTLPEVLNSF